MLILTLCFVALLFLVHSVVNFLKVEPFIFHLRSCTLSKDYNDYKLRLILGIDIAVFEIKVLTSAKIC